MISLESLNILKPCWWDEANKKFIIGLFNLDQNTCAVQFYPLSDGNVLGLGD